MAKTSGGNRSGGGGASAQKGFDYSSVNVSDVARGLERYSKIKYLGHGSIEEDWQSSARLLIDDVANMNLGFQSDVANTVKKYGYNISSKQAWVIANAAVKNKSKELLDGNGSLSFIFTGPSRATKPSTQATDRVIVPISRLRKR